MFNFNFGGDIDTKQNNENRQNEIYQFTRNFDWDTLWSMFMKFGKRFRERRILLLNVHQLNVQKSNVKYSYNQLLNNCIFLYCKIFVLKPYLSTKGCKVVPCISTFMVAYYYQLLLLPFMEAEI